jgi:hypothetical protein
MGAVDVKEAMAAAVSPKYRLDRDDWVKVDGEKLYRVVALKDFGDVEAGQRGGFIAGEHNLSHLGNCWVAGLARVMKNGRVEKNAVACDFSEVAGGLMTDDTLLCQHAHLGEAARMLDNSEGGGRTRIVGASTMMRNSRAGGDSLISGRSILTDDVYVHGTTVVGGTARLSGKQDLDGGIFMGSPGPAAPVMTVSGP